MSRLAYLSVRAAIRAAVGRNRAAIDSLAVGEKGDEVDQGLVDDGGTRQRPKPNDCRVVVRCQQIEFDGRGAFEETYWDITVAIDGTEQTADHMFVAGEHYTRDPLFFWTFDRPDRCDTDIPLSYVITVRHNLTATLALLDGHASALHTYHCPSEVDHETMQVRVGDANGQGTFTFTFHVRLTCPGRAS